MTFGSRWLFSLEPLGYGICALCWGSTSFTEGDDMAEQTNRKMSRAEAGRKGGQTTKQRYGEDHFGKIGRIGGKKGGETTKQRYGSEFYQRIGRIGGSK